MRYLYERLTGELEEKALRHTWKHWRRHNEASGAEVVKSANGFQNYVLTLEGNWVIDATMTASNIKIEVYDEYVRGVIHARTYKLDQWFARCKDAEAGHQIDMFELLEGQG